MNSLHEILPSLVKLGMHLSLSNPVRVPAYLGPDTIVPLASILAQFLASSWCFGVLSSN
jgi:hypothetical protein